MAFSAIAAAASAVSAATGVAGAISGSRNAGRSNAVAMQSLALEREIAQHNMETARWARPVADRYLDWNEEMRVRATDAFSRTLDASDTSRFFSDAIWGRQDRAAAIEDLIRGSLFGQNATNNALSLEARDYMRRVAGSNFDEARGVNALNFNQQLRVFDMMRGRQDIVDAAAARDRDSQASLLARERAFDEERLAFETDEAMRDRRRLLDRAQGFRERLDDTMQGLGQLAPRRQFTQEDVIREGDIRAQEARLSVDRAARMAASANEAALISAGVDSSTTGLERRAELAARIAPMYEEAYRRARDSALGYVSGQQQLEANTQQMEMERRRQVLQEVIEGALNPIRVEQALPGLPQGVGRVRSASVGNMSSVGPTINLTPAQLAFRPQEIVAADGVNRAFISNIPFTPELAYMQAALGGYGQFGQLGNAAGSGLTSLGGQMGQIAGSFANLMQVRSDAGSGSAVNMANADAGRSAQAWGAAGQGVSNFANRYGGDISRWLGWDGSARAGLSGANSVNNYMSGMAPHTSYGAY